MPKGILVGTLDATPKSIGINVKSFYASRFSVLLSGNDGGGTIALKGGIHTEDRQPIRVTNPADGTTHSALEFTAAGVYVFDACCEYLEFSISGGAAPDVEVTLFPENRP